MRHGGRVGRVRLVVLRLRYHLIGKGLFCGLGNVHSWVHGAKRGSGSAGGVGWIRCLIVLNGRLLEGAKVIDIDMLLGWVHIVRGMCVRNLSLGLGLGLGLSLLGRLLSRLLGGLRSLRSLCS